MDISKAVLITGCSTGIGRATAERLAAAGHVVYATARRIETIADLRELGCKTLALDVCDEESMKKAVAAVEDAHGAVGVLINNAGYGSEGVLEEVGMDEIRRQFDTNVFGLIRMTQLCLPGMRRQGWGKIINLSSMGGRLALPGGGIYHATKYAVEALSDALRFEVCGFGVDVVVIEPGPIKTEFGSTAIAKVEAVDNKQPAYDEFRDLLKQSIADAYDGPMGRLAAGPEAVAEVIEKAITVSKPRARYPVTAAARVLMGARKWLGARGFDAMLRLQLKPPSASTGN